MKNSKCDEMMWSELFHREFLWMEMSQRTFSWAEDDFGKLDEIYELFIQVCEATIKPRLFDYAAWKENGRKPISRLAVFKALVLKAVLNLPTTKDLLRRLREEPLARRLCGWSSPGQIPSEGRFSIIYNEFAERGISDAMFKDFIVQNHGDIPVETISYDSAPIPVRARAAATKKEVAALDPDQPEPPPRLEDQFLHTAEASLAELPTACDWGCKVDSHGKKKNWKGGKIHAAVTKWGLPVAWTYTSASLHDSQAMIPLAQQATERVAHLFDLADAAYDCTFIRMACEDLCTTPIIDRNRRWNEPDPSKGMSREEAKIYEQRTSAERFFSHLLDAHGGRTVRVRAPKKVALHLSFGMLVIAVEQFVRMMC